MRFAAGVLRSEEHTSELPVTVRNLVCRLLLEKKKNATRTTSSPPGHQRPTRCASPRSVRGAAVAHPIRPEEHRRGSRQPVLLVFFFIDPAPAEISPLSLHDALPI